MDSKMLGLSNVIKTVIIWGSVDLDRWLSENEVMVLDIKYAVSSSNSDKFLVIYK
jgi:GH35 family endo-1,4-beta-xylanase